MAHHTTVPVAGATQVPQSTIPEEVPYHGTNTLPATADGAHTAVPIQPAETTPPPPAPVTPAKAEKPKKEKPVKMVDAREVKHKRNKLILWILWLICMLVSAAYVALALISFRNLQTVYDNRGDTIGSRQLWGALTSTILTPALVIAYFGFGTFLLLKKTVSETGLTFAYGILTISAFWLSAVMLISVVTMNGYNTVAHHEWRATSAFQWTGTDATIFRITFILGYILVCLYFFLFLAFLFLSSVTKKLNLDGAHPTPQGKMI